MASHFVERMSARGMDAFDVQDADSILDTVFHHQSPQLMFASVRWSRLLGQMPSVPLLSDMAAEAGARLDIGTGVATELQTRLREGTPAEAREFLLGCLAQEAAKILGLAPSEVLDARRPLREYGLDSLMAVELRNAIARIAGRTLQATLLFDYPTVEALGEYLWTEVFAFAPEAMPLAAKADDNQLVEKLRHMTDAEVEAMLVAKLQAREERGSV
jgi:acyl carrier protein